MEKVDETSLKVFNQAKKYAEEVLFPMMESYQKYMRQSDFGTENLDDANNYPEEIREILRFNGLKASADVIYNLINTIKSTVLIHNNKEEIDQMETVIIVLEKIRRIFYENKQDFFLESYKGSKRIETLNREYFEKIKKIILTCYINTEILMTRNKLLFADSKDEFASDEEIKDQIKKEYIEG